MAAEGRVGPSVDRDLDRLRVAPAPAVEPRRLGGTVAHPWFDEQLSEMGRRYYQWAGFDVLISGPCDLPSDQSRITPDALHAWVVANRPDDAEAVVIGGNGFGAVGVITPLEAELDRSILSANQALLWAALRAAGADPSVVVGYGSLFSEAR